MASQSLMAYSLGLIAFIQIKVLAPGYYARQDTKTPVKIGVIAMALNMGFNLILIWPLAHAGLALATSLSAFVNAYLLWRGLQKQAVFQAQVGWQKFIIQSVLAGAAMAAVIYLLAFDQIDWFAIQGWLLGALLLGVIAAAAITYFAVLWVSGMRLRDWRRAVAK
jgi:putative peptidoglycan lipid II flippase